MKLFLTRLKTPYWFLVIFLLLVPDAALAQSPYVSHYSLSRRNDPVSTNKIFQDTNGYVWFATNKGLYRFDGKRYRHFTLADSLPELNVTAIAQDSLGRIWTGHQDGSIAFLERGYFRKFMPSEGLSPEPVSDLMFDWAGNLWFATFNDGLYYFTRDRLFRLDEEEGMPDLFIYDLAIDSLGAIWAGTDGGIAVCKLNANNVQIDVIDSKAGLQDNIIKKIVFGAGRVYLGTEDAGVLEFNPASRQIASIVADPWRFGSINDMIWKDDQLWISSTSAGLRLYDTRKSSLRSYDPQSGLDISSVGAMLLDHERSIWGATRSGIIRTPGDMIEFVSLSNDGMAVDVLAVAQDCAGNIWYADMNGLHKQTPFPSGFQTSSILAKTPYHKFRVISLYVDPFGFVWAGLYGEGVLRIAPDGKIKHFGKELRNGNVLHISGKDNVVWLATLGGCDKIVVDKEQFQITHYHRENGLSSDFIYQAFTDSKNRVWFATDGKGVDMLDENGFHHIEEGLTSHVIYGFAEDKKGNIWVNAQEGGIHKWNGKSFEPLRPRLRSENIRSIANDRNGNLLIAHDLGLDILDPETGTISILGNEVGLENHVINLNAVNPGSDGRVLFGSTSGIVLYKGESGERARPNIVIESVRVNGQTLDATRDMTFSYDENDLNINFLGFWYRDPENVRYQYKMENFDPDSIVTADNSVSYSKLPPGEYSFALSGFVGGNASSDQAVLKFRIRPPFWETNLFYIFSIVTIAISGYGILRYRERRLMLDKLVLERRVAERTREIQRNTEEIQAQNEEIMAQAEEIKGINENLEMLVKQRTAELERKNKALEEYAFINAHKLRSPVASILGLVNLLSKTHLGDEAKAINQHLKQSAEELDDIVRSITQAIERGEK